MSFSEINIKFIHWRENNIKESTFVLFLSFVVGLLTSLATVLLKWLIHFIQGLLTSPFSINDVNYLYLLYPAIGIFLASIFVKYVVKDNIGHGVTLILYAISRRQSRLKSHNMWSSLVGSAITIGFGGSVGAEAPIVLTGSAIGSNLGSYFKMDPKTLMLLMGCGASGAIAGIFKAPMAGMLFTIEVLMLDMTFTSMMPLIIASVTAASLSYSISGTQPMFPFSVRDPFVLDRIPWVIFLGVACGLISLYVIRGMNSVEGWYKKMKNQKTKLFSGAIILSILIFLFPPLYGEGYDSISEVIEGNPLMLAHGSIFYGHAEDIWVLLGYSVLIMFFKVIATASTNGAGGVGGVFAPSLFIGCIMGFIVATVVNRTGIGNVSPENFALMGMAGVMTAVMHAPLTSVFLIAELTGGYELFLPLLIVACVSYLTIYLFEKNSIYSMRLAQKGELVTHHKDKAVLTMMKIENVIETDFDVVTPNMYLGNLVKVISKSKRNIFPVVDNDGVFQGIVTLNDIRNIMFRTELYFRFKVLKLMISPPAKVYINESMESVMLKFDDTNAWNLPVVDENEKYLGFVSKSKIFNSYRKVLVDFTDE